MQPANHLEIWTDHARRVGNSPSADMPLGELLEDAREVAAFFQKYWQPHGDLPGLASAGTKLPQRIGGEIASLVQAIPLAQERYLEIIQHRLNPRDLMERGERLLSEIAAALEWYLDDTATGEQDVLTESLPDVHRNSNASNADLAFELYDYAEVASELAEELDGIGGFDKRSIDEAFEIARKLVEVSESPAIRHEEAREALSLRDGLIELLHRRLRLVRAAARFVFRDHPVVLREASSRHHLRRRAARHRAEKVARAYRQPRRVESSAPRFLPRS
jgi:hypothetical protein